MSIEAYSPRALYFPVLEIPLQDSFLDTRMVTACQAMPQKAFLLHYNCYTNQWVRACLTRKKEGGARFGFHPVHVVVGDILIVVLPHGPDSRFCVVSITTNSTMLAPLPSCDMLAFADTPALLEELALRQTGF